LGLSCSAFKPYYPLRARCSHHKGFTISEQPILDAKQLRNHKDTNRTDGTGTDRRLRQKLSNSSFFTKNTAPENRKSVYRGCYGLLSEFNFNNWGGRSKLDLVLVKKLAQLISHRFFVQVLLGENVDTPPSEDTGILKGKLWGMNPPKF
jgi:hypothetical protein